MRFLTKVAWIAAAVLFGLYLMMPNPASSEPALLCTPDKKQCVKITLPKPGTCKWIRGYKVCK